MRRVDSDHGVTDLTRVSIVLIRHAQAMSEGLGLSDAHRYLTAAGRQQARDLAALLVDTGLEVGAMVTSPLVRAVQTAELVAAGVGHRGEIAIEPQLRPDGAIHLASASLPALGAVVLAVSHEPLVSALCGALSSVGAPFRTAELRALDAGRLLWRLP